MSDKKLVVTQGFCPKCGLPLDYGSSDFQDDGVYFECSCQACGFFGKEWYNMTFDGFSANPLSVADWKHYEAGAEIVDEWRKNHG